MAKVSFDDSARPTVELTIEGPKGKKTITAIVDTGFSGFLCIPERSLNEVGLPRPEDSPVTSKLSLANNTLIDVALCMASAHLDGDEAWGMCAMAQEEGDSLFGMLALLSFKQRLMVDITDDSVELSPTAYKAPAATDKN